MKEGLFICVVFLAVTAPLVVAQTPSLMLFRSGDNSTEDTQKTDAKNITNLVGQESAGYRVNRESKRDAKVYYDLGVKHALARRHEEAIRAFRQAISFDSANGDAYFSIGNVYAELARWNEAANSYRKALSLKPRDGEAYNSLGKANAKLGLHGQAVDAFKKAISLHPKWAEPHYNLSGVYYQLKMDREAEASYKQAISLRPDYAARPPQTGIPTIGVDSIRASEKAGNQANKVYVSPTARNSSDAIRERRVEQTSDGKVKPSGTPQPFPVVSSIKTNTAVKPSAPSPRENRDSAAIRPNQNDAKYYYKLGVKYGLSKHYEAAAAAFKKAILLKPNYADAYFGLGDAYADSRRWKEAVEAYEQVVRLDPKDKEAHYKLGEAYVKSSAPSPRENRDRAAIRPNQDDANYYYKLGVKYGLSNRYELAAAAFKQAILFKPNYADAYFGLGHAYADSRRWKESVEAYEQVVRLEPKDKEALYKLGEAYVKSRAQTINDSLNGNGATESGRVNNTAPVPFVQTSAAPDASSGGASGVANASNGTLLKTDNPTVPRVAVRSSAEPSKATGGPDLVDIYRVGGGDVLDIQLLNAPTRKSSLYIVLGSGLLEYPLINSPLVVAGMTTDEIKERLTSELRRLAVHDNPQVAVSVREYDSHKVIVSGLVNEPGTKIIRREAVPLYVIIADAQPRPEAGRALIRSYATGRDSIVDLADMTGMNMLIHPSDVITVAKRTLEYLFIGGQVNAPGQKDFHTGMTLLQGVLAAGGTTRLADGKIKVWRQGEDGHLVVTEYVLKDIESGKVPDPRVQAGDRIEVTQRGK